MDITPLTSDTQQESTRKDGNELVQWVDEKTGEGGSEERMCDRAADTGSGYLHSQSGKLSAAPVSLLRRTFTCVTRFKFSFVKWKGSENIFLQSGPQYPGKQQPRVKPRGSPIIPLFAEKAQPGLLRMKNQPKILLVASQICT